MNATFFANELSNIASESKRKNAELRNAADRALQDLKALPATSEQQLAADLSRRPAFIEPFLIACRTHNAKFAASGIVCLQRLVISRGLPKSCLNDALEAFNVCSDLGLDIQLKILQALPSLLQNYAGELEGELLASTLQVCSSLQAVKASTVSGVANATLQQLVTTVFERVVGEDRYASEIATTAEIPGEDGPIKLRPAAHDAYRIFRDLAMVADERKPTFVRFTSLSAETGLELIWSCIDANPDLFDAHSELSAIIGSNVFPLVVRALSERLSFSVTVRALRILDLMLDRYVPRFPEDCEVALGLCTQALEPDLAPAWKRALVMEVLRNFFTDSAHVVEAYAGFDNRDGGKSVIQDLMSAFVRLSSEKPSAIGLGYQSSTPIGPSQKELGVETAAMEASGGMAGVFSSALGVAEVNVAGISAQWSLPKSTCIEQLDKSEPPFIPETYVHALVLDCLSGLSDSLARVVLPLTVTHEKNKSKPVNGVTQTDGRPESELSSTRTDRTNSFRTRAVPLNPLDAKDAPYHQRIKTVASLVDTCWPAVLATSSTFLNAALDDLYFRNLIKAYQRFAQVAGLLRLEIPRDALMTTLAKASVPPHVLSAVVNEPVKSPMLESGRTFPNAKGLLGVDNFVTPASSHPHEKDRRPSAEPAAPVLTVRNLLCLRALLNLAIALGPTLGTAFEVVVSSLRHADLILSTTTPQQLTRHGSNLSHKGGDSPSVVQAFSAEVAAVEAAAARLMESTADYPDNAFMNVLGIFCGLLHSKIDHIAPSPKPDHPPTPTTPRTPRRTFSGLPGIGHFTEVQTRDYHFVIPKLGNLVELNMSRFMGDDPSASGWTYLVDELSAIAKNNAIPREARRSAANVLVQMAGESIARVMKEPIDDRAVVQRRSLVALLRLVDAIYLEEGELTPTDLEVQGHVLDSLRAILERCGESLVAGWNRIVAIISYAFDHEGSTVKGSDDEKAHIDWNQVSTEFVSTQIGRLAFALTQLVCSDFLESLPTSVVPSLIELLHRFMGQVEDLNTALTTVTMVWNVSDFLLGSFEPDELGAFVEQARQFDDLEEDLQPQLRDSSPSQWLLLLIRLRDAAGQPLKEVRRAAFQTACNVFKSHGDRIPSSAWDLLLRITVFRISMQDSMLYHQEEDSETEERPRNTESDIAMSKAIISGNAEVIAQHLQTVQEFARLPSLWEVFLGMLERYIDVGNQDLNAAAFSALASVLSHIDPSPTAWKGPIYRTLSLWLKRSPTVMDAMDGKRDVQDAYVAYADAGAEVYRLTGDTMSISQTRTMIDNLFTCLRDSDGPLYGADVNTMSPLQSKVMQLFKGIRADQPDIPACLITVAAKLAALHHDMTNGVSFNTTPTFVAIASEAIPWLQQLISTHISDPDVFDSDSILLAISSLKRLIQAKYAYRLKHKSTALWRSATATALMLATSVLEQVDISQIDATSRSSIWAEFVDVSNGIVNAHDLHVVEDRTEIHEDQLFDIESFGSIREVLIPRLGDSGLPDEIRLSYTSALFEASIIHPTEPGEIPETSESALKGIGRLRRGRVKQVPYSLREDMAYACWKQLIALASHADKSASHQKLAQAAAPLLVLRLALPIRAYIVDQPIRGRRPQPLSELEELLFCFESIKTLRIAPKTLVIDASADHQSGDKDHLYYLYPLLLQALRVAGDKWSGAEEVRSPLQDVLSAIASLP